MCGLRGGAETTANHSEEYQLARFFFHTRTVRRKTCAKTQKKNCYSALFFVTCTRPLPKFYAKKVVTKKKKVSQMAYANLYDLIPAPKQPKSMKNFLICKYIHNFFFAKNRWRRLFPSASGRPSTLHIRPPAAPLHT